MDGFVKLFVVFGNIYIYIEKIEEKMIPYKKHHKIISG